MTARTKNKPLHMDSLLLVTTAALLSFGLLMLYSATLYVDIAFWHQQLKWVALGLLAMVAAMYFPYTLLQRLAVPIIFVTLVLLVIVLLFGQPLLGAQRSFEILGISVQPGVFARLATVIYIAAWLASKGEQLHQVRYGLFPFAIILGVLCGLVALQPDLSIAALLAATGLLMFFFAGGDPIQIFLSLLIGGSTFGLLAWQLTHARERLINYVAALKDPSQLSYHAQRSLMALAEGGITGVGVGRGLLKTGYLPFPHTDSIFAVIGEETGLIGVALVLGLFALFAYRGYRIALETTDPFGALLAFGVTTMIVLGALLNILVMTGLVPFAGTALPFFSYGGSEMLVTLTGVGVLLGVSRGRPKGDWDAILDRSWRDWRARLSGSSRRTGFAGH
ncbi:MAG: FtsW/RodA/SpoVE family cell cycle protein [Chloroflexi bacterium]|nr:FtsW/RodA/SpoVE family cell cycle protein [Chloroflexota bacterium]OQB02314.1 MAG: Lipid II flippase FtsW [Chloroflexi bacterium ADurb.Bin222]HOS79566.1 FtsW/RodA/SpoVE family cell cycle protein [Anaerolineae bacterium]HQJ10814.1 FtsW/RodA/SpoVE family cell cycle protein [Anaerolineae bacterium]